MSADQDSAEALLAALSDQHRAFALHYAQHRNAYKAARAAGYAESTARDASWAIKRRKDVRAALDALFREIELSPQELKAILASHATATIEPFLQDDGSLTVATDEARAALHTLQSAKHTRRTVTTESATIEQDTLEIKLHDVQRATIELLKIAGELGPDLEVTFKVLVPEPGKK